MRRVVFAFVAILSIAACEQRNGEAIVLEKEYIAAAVDQTAAAAESPRSSVEPAITVDSYVMKPEVRGTSQDPRALKDEQWLVKIQLVEGARTFNVPADRSQFERVTKGDRVRVRYHVGKYTGTIWGAEIVGR